MKLSLLRCMSPLLAQSGHADRRDPRALSGAKRTRQPEAGAAVIDPERTLSGR